MKILLKYLESKGIKDNPRIIDSSGQATDFYLQDLLEDYTKQLRLHNVSQQRELLLAYEKYTSQQVIGKENSRMAKSLVDGFLANNCA